MNSEINILWNAYQYCPIPVLLLKNDGNIVRINPEMLNLLGYSESEILKTPGIVFWIRRLISDEILYREARDTIASIISGKSRINEKTYTITTKNGQRRCIVVTAHDLIIDGNQTGYIVIHAQDETESQTAARQLREIEGRYSALFYRSLDLVYIHDPEGNFIDANPSALKLLGYKRKDIGSLTYAVILSHDQLQKAMETTKDIVRNGYQKDLTEFTFNRKEGGIVHVQTNGILLHRDGEPYAVFVVGRNITEMKKNEQVRKNYIENLDFLAKSAMEIVQLSSSDNIYEFIARKIKDIVGKAVVTVNRYDKKSGLLITMHQAGLESHIESVIRLIGKDPVGMTYHPNSEILLQMKTGKLKSIGGLYEVSLHKIPKTLCRNLESILGIGRIYGIGFTGEGILYGVCTIITFRTTGRFDTEVIETFASQISGALKRWQTENALRQSEEKYQALTENINDIIYSTTAEGIITFVGPQMERFGYTYDEIVDRPFSDFIIPEDKETALKDFQRSIETGEEFPTRFRIPDKDGVIRWFEDNGKVQRNDDGIIIGLNGILRDITSRVKIEEALRVSETELREQKKQLEQKNAALKELIHQIEIEKNSIKDDVIANIDEILLPLLDRLSHRKNPEKYIDVLKHLLRDITSSFGKKISTTTTRLTPRETEISAMIESGLHTKEIAALLNVSVRTIENHRKNIRKKLNIQHKGLNLSNYLKQMK